MRARRARRISGRRIGTGGRGSLQGAIQRDWVRVTCSGLKVFIRKMCTSTEYVRAHRLRRKAYELKRLLQKRAHNRKKQTAKLRVTHALALYPLWAYCFVHGGKDVENCPSFKKARALSHKWAALYVTSSTGTSRTDLKYAARLLDMDVEELETRVKTWSAPRRGKICGAIRFGMARRRRASDDWGLAKYSHVAEATNVVEFERVVSVNNRNDSETNSRRGLWPLARAGAGYAYDYTVATQSQFRLAIA